MLACGFGFVFGMFCSKYVLFRSIYSGLIGAPLRIRNVTGAPVMEEYCLNGISKRDKFFFFDFEIWEPWWSGNASAILYSVFSLVFSFLVSFGFSEIGAGISKHCKIRELCELEQSQTF